MVKQTGKSSIKFKPLGERVLIRPELKETKTASGIIIPDSAKKEERQHGSVVAVGSGRIGSNGQTIPLRVAVGDKVLFRANDWDKEDIDGTEYYLVDESSILGILSN